MTIFAVEYLYGIESETQRTKARPKHREWLAERAEEDVILASGPFADGSGALLIFQADSKSSLRQLLGEDPMALAGGVTATKITEWAPVIGQLAHYLA